MSRSNSAALQEHSNRSALSAFLFRQIFALTGFALFMLLVLAVAALATWNEPLLCD
jgi:DNA segregation ATPase FtsK/SpoIIIE, S-DNA-T family